MSTSQASSTPAAPAAPEQAPSSAMALLPNSPAQLGASSSFSPYNEMFRAAFAGPQQGPTVPRDLEIPFLWNITVVKGADSGAHVVIPSKDPIVMKRLAQFSYANITGVRLQIFPYGQPNLQLAARIIPLARSGLETAGVSKTLDHPTLLASSYTSILVWRSNVTVPLETRLTLAWPEGPIGTSLMTVGPGLATPAIALSLGGTGEGLEAGTLSVLVTLTVTVGGIGHFGLL